MNISNNNQSKTALKCSNIMHNDSPIDIHCIYNKICSDGAPLCEFCVPEFHNFHKSDCITILRLGQSLKANPINLIQSQYHKLQESFKEVIQTCRHNVENIAKDIQLSEKDYKSFFNDTLEGLQKPSISDLELVCQHIENKEYTDWKNVFTIINKAFTIDPTNNDIFIVKKVQNEDKIISECIKDVTNNRRLTSNYLDKSKDSARSKPSLRVI